jgi:hypothetical protein
VSPIAFFWTRVQFPPPPLFAAAPNNVDQVSAAISMKGVLQSGWLEVA